MELETKNSEKFEELSTQIKSLREKSNLAIQNKDNEIATLKKSLAVCNLNTMTDVIRKYPKNQA